jgi:tetratricopeptide (TPR) repeat protein
MSRLKFKLTWSLALLALPLAAQSDRHQEEPLTARLWSTTPVTVDSAPAPRESAPSTISAELLRYPLSGKALSMLRKALEISDHGDHARAIEQLEKTLAKCPGTDAYVDSLLGVEYLKTEQIREAVDALQQSVKLLPHDASNHANLGLAYFSEAQYDRAEGELKRALELDPHYKMATQLLTILAAARTAPTSLAVAPSVKASGDSR